MLKTDISDFLSELFMLRCFISDLFDNYMQQDAHEFLNYLLNRVAELLQGKKTDFKKQQQTSCYMKELENNDIHDMYDLNSVAFLLNERSKLQMFRNKLSLVMRKPAFCICENKDVDQLRGNREADQCLCFRYTDSTIPLLPKSEISSLQPSVAVQPGLCMTWSKTPKAGFLTTRLNYKESCPVLKKVNVAVSAS